MCLQKPANTTVFPCSCSKTAQGLHSFFFTYYVTSLITSIIHGHELELLDIILIC